MAEKLQVKGIAIKPGLSKNGINYTEEELHKFAPTLSNKPFLKDHFSAVDNTIGIVENGHDVGGGIVGYNGWIKEDGTNLLEKVKDRRIKEVSIGAFAERLVKENDDDEFVTAIGLHALELSLTPTPAMVGTSLSQSLESIREHAKNDKVKVLAIAESIGSIESKIPKKAKVKKEKKKVEKKDNPIKKKKTSLSKKSKESIKKKEVNKMTEENIKKLQEQLDEEKAKTAKLEDEKKASSEKLTQANEKIAKVKEARMKKLVKEYKGMAEVRKIKSVDVSKMKESSVKALIETLKQVKVKEKKTDTTHGKVAHAAAEAKEVNAESAGQYVCEDFGQGMALWKHPNADGSLTRGGDKNDS